jgi:hypothetical protein
MTVPLQCNYEQNCVHMRDFVFERSAAIACPMWMAFAITVAGIGLAAAQLRASYLLAKARRDPAPQGSASETSRDKIAIQSAIVGVVVLAMSLAFFLTFVLHILQEPDPLRRSKLQTRPTAGEQTIGGPGQEQKAIDEQLGIEPNFGGQR